MPLYAYECSRCDVVFETMGPMSRCSDPMPCPDCGSLSQRRYLPPTCVSDCTQYRGDNTGGAQFSLPGERKLYMDPAKAAGVTTEGKVYYPELARFQGDPKAWCGSNDDIRRVATENGYNVDGDVKVRARRDVEPEVGGINETIVEEGVANLLKANPEMKRERAVEDFVNRAAPAKHKRIVKNKKKAKV